MKIIAILFVSILMIFPYGNLYAAEFMEIQMMQTSVDEKLEWIFDTIDTTFDEFPEPVDFIDFEDDEEEEEEGEETEYRTMTGYGNNAFHDEWGMAGTQLKREMDSEYEDDMNDPSGESRPSARAISNAVSAQPASDPSDTLTSFVWQWGQFLDHDISLTKPSDPAEYLEIEIPEGDPYFDPLGEGGKVMGIQRSKYDHETGKNRLRPREQMNDITSFIDASNVYGSNEERADALRTFEGGKLKMSEGNLLPYNSEELPNADDMSSDLFLAGDVRANEQLALIAMHTLFAREHNRLTDEIAEEYSFYTDEDLYQEARRIVGAQIEIISFNEFLPALFGEEMPDYEGYDRFMNPGIMNMFSTALYRFGHTMLPSELLRLEEDSSTIPDGNVALRDAFFQPSRIADEGGIEPLLRGLAAQRAEKIDTLLIDDVRNFLFGPPGSGGFDLGALNIQRGRDHGLPGYNDVRKHFDLEEMDDFDDITSNAALADSLGEMYDDVDDIDLWVGALAEDPYENGHVGELLYTSMLDQFLRLRDGDRFWYQNQFSEEDAAMLEETKLSDIIRRNTDIENIPDNVFVVE